MISRRRAVLALGLLALAAPPTSLAQPAPGVRRIGFLAGRSRSTPANPDTYYDAFVQGMRGLGYVEGKNLIIEWRFADDKYERLPTLASELVKLDVEVIVTHATPPTRAAQRATRTIPIVTTGVGDPVANGFAASLARPGGNVTGHSQIVPDLIPKQFELLVALAPGIQRVGALLNPSFPLRGGYLKRLQEGAKYFGIDVAPVDAGSPDEIRHAFAAMVKQGAQAAFITADSYFSSQGRLLAELALAHRLPMVGTYREHAQAGMLVAYGQDVAEQYRRAARYVDSILKGAKPGDMPFEQPSRIHLAINVRTAKTLGLTVPQQLRLRADELIE